MKVWDNHVSSLVTTAELSSYTVAKAIPPLDVIAVLNKAKISFVLVGAYGLGGWMDEPRATQDVDVIVAAKHVKKAIKVLLAAFPDLDAEDLPVVVRMRSRETKKVAIDVMKPNQQLFRVAFKHTHMLQTGGQRYKIPSLEMGIAMKFAPMVSLYRQDVDKLQDAHDFILMVRSNPNIDSNKLEELGELVYSGGGRELLELVRRARTGEKLNL